MATTAIPHFEPFSVELAPITLAARWTRWTTRFENLMTAMNVTDPARKKAMLLHLAEEGVYDIYDGLIVPDVPVDADPAENNVYIAARKALDDHFSPKKNADFEIYNFRLAKQLQHETVDTYHARLRSRAKYCQFTDTDKEIKSHIIQTCVSTRLHRRALSESTLTLVQLLDIARSMEAAERQVKAMDNGQGETRDAVAAVGNRSQNQRQRRRNATATTSNNKSGQLCRNCGNEFPHPGGRQSCPA